MKIYFAASIRGGRDDQHIYEQFIEMLGKYGTVLTEHIGLKSLGSLGEQTRSVKNIYERDMDWVRGADVVVAEVTQPSLGVGFEIGYASQCLKKPVLALYRCQEGKSLSAMVAGCSEVDVREYSEITDVSGLLSNYFSSRTISV